MKTIHVRRPALALACAVALLASGCATKTNVARLAPETLVGLKLQARLQLDSRRLPKPKWVLRG